MSDNGPEATIRDGRLKATIWRNESEKGPFFTTNLSRTYEDKDGKLQDTTSFRSQDLLSLSELARQAHHRVGDLRRDAFKDQRKTDQSKDRARDRMR